MLQEIGAMVIKNTWVVNKRHLYVVLDYMMMLIPEQHDGAQIYVLNIITVLMNVTKFQDL